MYEPGPRVFEVEKKNLRQTRTYQLAERVLKDGEVRLLIDDFALTANNITYAAFGETMGYWKFFPSEDSDWGRIPVWGFATVNESLHEEIDPGERFYGYFPMGTELIVQADQVRESGFIDGAPHRAGLALVYNQYIRVAADPAYRADFEALQMLFRPLFQTSFLIHDQLAEAGFHGAEQIIMSSASSKTALALAWFFKKTDMNAIALTSSRSRAFARNVQCYNEVFLYDEISDQLTQRPSVFVDFSGDPAVIRAVHTRLGDHLKASIRVGATNWKAGAAAPSAEPLPGPEPVFFFAPDQGKKRVEAWGPKEYSDRISEKMLAFFKPASRWVKPVRGIGDEAVHEFYERVLSGDVLPSEGCILSFGL